MMSMAFLAEPTARGRRMAEHLKELNWPNLLTALCSVATLAIVGGGLVFGAGGWREGDSAAISDLKGQVGILSSQVSRLSEKIDAGPRADQMQDISRHLAAGDGRMDSLDTRMRTIETKDAELAARLEGIEAASRAQVHR